MPTGSVASTARARRRVGLSDLPGLAKEFARLFSPPMVVFLSGPPGAGKTSLMRALLTVLGHRGVVPSPSFSLVESYQFEHCTVHHFDLYRIESVEELEHLGIRDRLCARSIAVFEWPERALDEQGRLHLPKADFSIRMSYDPDDPARRLVSWACPEEQSG